MSAEYGDALSEREIEIVELVAEGLTNREIAARVYLSPNTVKVHLRNIFTKTGVSSRTELTVLAMQEGWIEVPGASPETADEEENSETSSTSEMRNTSGEVAATLHVEPSPHAIWPSRRWIELVMGTLLALVILILPQRPIAQTNAVPPIPSPGTPMASATALETEDGWQELPSLPVRRAGMGVVATDGKIYVIGGMTQDGTSDRVDVYSIETEDWQVAAPRPLALGYVSAALLDKKILIPGGCDAGSGPNSAVHLYDIETDTWSEVSPLPTPLCAYALSTYQNQVYLFGGWDGRDYQALAYVYMLESDTWEKLPSPSEARAFGAADVLQDRIFYVGGYDGREWDTCEIYFPKSNRWDLCEPMIQPRGGLGLVAMGGRLQAIGGGWGNTYVAFNERYDPATNRWEVLETPIVGKWTIAGLTSWDGALYAIGGWDGDYLNRTYRLEIFQWRVYIPITSSGRE